MIDKNRFNNHYLHSINGITLVALVITIIVLIILATVSINALWGENGVITEAQEVAFRAEMVSLKDQVTIVVIDCEMDEISIAEKFEKVRLEETQKWDADLKKEIIYWGQYDIGVSEITKQYAKNNWNDILNTYGVLDNLYYVDEETAEGKEKTYLYDAKVDIVYKIPVTRIGKYIVHSIEELDDLQGVVVTEKLITDESKFINVDGISHYEPDLSGFALEKTSIVYYDDTATNSISISAQEYLENGKQRVIEKNEIEYEFYNYNSQKWANILIENNGMKSYWVWIPRYAYNIKGNQTEIIFVNTSDKQLDGSALPSDYIVHSAFKDGKKGIWVSKYEAIQTANQAVSNFPYYIPDMTGFNENNTYIEVYNSKTDSFEETKLKDIDNLTDFSKQNKWFDYNNQIWANIKIVEPATDTESWWVWIPRYAYSITGENTSIIFIDTKNNPLDGSTLPSNYIVHAAFKDGKKGIWVSKYEPILEPTKVGSSKVNAPDMKGFNVDNTYIECYDEATKTFKEQTLRSILSEESAINASNIVETAVIDNSKINGTWYQYDKQTWANIKVVDSVKGMETWWVWIPRYAYNITGIQTSIIFLDTNDNPLDGGELPSNYIPHSAFKDDKEGIWVSKYEPIEK